MNDDRPDLARTAFEPDTAPTEPQTIGESAQARAEATPPLIGGKPMPGSLDTRAKPADPERIRRGVVQSAYLGAAAVISGAFIFAFVAVPGWQAEARAKAAAENQRTPPGSVRPADVLADAPASYADLTREPEEIPADMGTGTPPRVSAGPAHPPRVVVQRVPGEPRQTIQAAGPAAPRGPSEAERARTSGLFIAAPGGQSAVPVPKEAPAPPTGPDRITRRENYAEVYGDRAVLAPLSPYELKAGTVIPAALLTAVDTEREGNVLAVVTENVFDTVTGTHLLVPQGARLIGRFDGDQTYGERRAFLVWERIVFPDGRSISLGDEPGVDSSGAGGVQGRVDHRIPQLIVASVFAGAVTSLGEAARRESSDRGNSLLGDAGDAAALEAARVGGRLIDRELEVKPTIRVAQGTRIQVLLTRDLILEPAS